MSFKKILVANRGEIAIRVFRACHELGIRTVAIYSEEDKGALFRTKADEAYQIGRGKGPVEAYLSIDEIIELAKKKQVDAIHPGYGFLSENMEFAKKCEENDIEFIGPTSEMMDKLGEKIKCKIVAESVGVPIIPGTNEPIKSAEKAKELASLCGYPIMLKAAAGGGGRGMRIVRSEEELVDSYISARNEAKKAFGIDDIFIEKYIENPKHIEVQLLGDKYGNIVHLYERDCSIQRRHQKLVEYTPAFSLPESLRESICNDAIKIAKAVNYRSAGTAEFLVDSHGNYYFIEMNPRIQVEHTVTEMLTSIDIVQCQILIAQGFSLGSKEIGIGSQKDVHCMGYSIQCRITTEDPMNNFFPDTGKIDMYRTSSGFGVRLDGGNGFTGAIISPYYDSLLVKVITHGRTFKETINKAKRSVRETKIDGVKTNSDFLINVLSCEEFEKGICTTNFIENHPELLNVIPKEDKELKLLNFLGEKVVNEGKHSHKDFDIPQIPKFSKVQSLNGTKQILDRKGPLGLTQWIKNEKKLLLTDTTMRDAHQSLMATRLRTKDMAMIAEPMAHLAKDLFSIEMWGGATFDVAYRFLKEDPWERLEILRKKIPNVLFQMLIRGANGVGYKNYPDNVIREFIKESADKGIDVFRIFDSLNWLKGMEIATDEVLKTGKVAEVCMCYTGDILDGSRKKYDLNYYIKMAKEIESMGAHILGIKDMSALLKPYAAYELISALKEEISIPIHLHTHDTSGNGVATVLMAAQAGVDIVDTAFNSMSGLTSQPALNSVVAALENTKRDTKLDCDSLQQISDYWESVRPIYEDFESELKATSAEIYKYEIPGGQYSNLKQQVKSFGLGHKFQEIKDMYKEVNGMVGDIVKVTPSSKMIGDMAIFMVKNNIDSNNILEKGEILSFPDSAVDYFKGMMGQPNGGFPKGLQKIVLKDEDSIECRPGELLKDEDFEKIEKILREELEIIPEKKDIIAYALYPKVFKEYVEYKKTKGDFSNMPSVPFFHGIVEGETVEIEVEEGKVFLVKLIKVLNPDSKGMRKVIFEVNGFRREIDVKDRAIEENKNEKSIIFASKDDHTEIGASIPGKVVKVLIKKGDKIEKNQKLMILEAMKMETNIVSKISGEIEEVLVSEGSQVESGQLIIKLKSL
ncbi:pyruvate carboxylase [Clostridium sp. CTA-19]